jgi:predicted carbohydrate-binding protein with CBM5 and CBM33 domain
MRDHSLKCDTHDSFGWLKTTGLVLVLFAAMIASAIVLARASHADGCAPNCRARHNECRLQTKGAPNCDGQLQACVTRCMAARSPQTPATATTLLPTSGK